MVAPGFMMRHLLLLFLLLVGLVPPAGADATTIDAWTEWRTPRFRTLGGGAGLPHATTTAIVQGSDGLMWIGTRGGLARYDGQRIKIFRQSSRDRSSLPDNYIRALLPLPHGGMLIGTNVGGAVRYDPLSGRFLAMEGADGVGDGTRILAFVPDGDGGALIASDHGVYHYDGRRHRVTAMAGAGNPLAGGAFAVHRDPDGTIFAGGDKGLFRWRPDLGGFRRVATPAIGDVWAISRDATGRLWIGTGSNGIFVQQSDGRFFQPPVLAADAPLIGHRTIRAFANGVSGTVWVGTDGMGILRVEPAAGFAARSIRNIPANAGSLAGDTVRDLTFDRSGRLWAATEAGASQADPSVDAMFSITNAMPDPRQSLAETNVRGLMVDRRDRIWVGMSNGMIDRVDRVAGTVRHLKLKGRHGGQDVKAFVERHDGTVLAGGRGVIAIDPETLADREIALPDIGNLPVIALAHIGDRLMIGTYKGLFVWNERTRAMRIYRHVDGDDTSLANNEVINIVASPDGRPWIATPGGVSRFDPATGRFATYRNYPTDPFSLPQNYTGSIVRSRGALWIGTYGGVARGTLVGDEWRFRAITEARGLDNDNIAALIADRAGRIWTTSASGISVIDPTGRRVRIVSRRDGLTADAFNQRVAAMTQGGDLLFGGTGGLLVLRPDRMLATRTASSPTLVPTEIEQDGRPLAIDPFPGRHPIRIDHVHHGVRIGFALTDYAAPEEVRYRYRLQGFDDRWVTVPDGTPASAIYTNLPGGEYVLYLQAHIPGVNPRLVTTTIDVIVARAWYELWFVRLAIGIALLLAIVAIVQMRTLVLRRRTSALEKIVDRRTEELRAANVTLEHLANTDPLTGLANRRTLMARLEAARETAMRSGTGYAVAMIDIDHFKRINDTHGHQVGDMVLRGVAARIAGSVRAVDCVARYGGEELAILFADTIADEAWATTERLRRSIACCPIDAEGILIGVTVSGGIAGGSADEAPAATLHCADLAMYRAKAAGRDRIERADASDAVAADPGYAAV